MFIRFGLLLLLAFFVETFKVEDQHKHLGIRNIENPNVLKTSKILKNIGKRYFPANLEKKNKVPDVEYYQPDLGLTSFLPSEFREPSLTLSGTGQFRHWNNLSDDDVNMIRRDKTSLLVNTLVLSTSVKNWEYYFIIKNLEAALDPEFFAEICEDGRQLNRYQYMKFVTHSANLYDAYDKFISFELLPTNRNAIHAKAKFVTLDTKGLKVRIEYEFKAKLTFSTELIFSLVYLKQGGSCVNDGQANIELDEGVKDIVAEELEGLKTAPTVKLFFDLFTPNLYKGVGESPDFLPMHWLSGLNSSVVQIDVCQEGVEEPVKFTPFAFCTWYKKFDIMWHRKSNDVDHIVQILEMTDESISARVTMRLQMGLKPEEPEHDWNFKFTGKKLDGVWVLDSISVLCTVTVNYKDSSAKNINDLVVAYFVNELGYLNDTQWYFTPDFIQSFSKHKDVAITDCVKGEKAPINKADLFIKDKSNKHGIKFTKYHFEEEEVTLPAHDTQLFRFDTIGVAADSTSEEEKVYEWAYEVKWDQKDQFYYIFRMGIGCAKPLTIARLFEPISFNSSRRRLPLHVTRGK